ncbi:hypothetical protein [Thiomicrorhabdus indica]|uniref:hypothetical protein n=1 Tax=Thiomicrorhabdus indica TaxID=2267253 RepID=UPI002AA756A7|nr:hypothetical protein [Thiomicrorhabdus indica]
MRDFTIDLCKKDERDLLLKGEPNRIEYVPYVDVHFKVDCSVLRKIGLFEQSCIARLTYADNLRFEVEYVESDNLLRYDRVIFRYKLNDEFFIERDYGIDWLDRTFGRQPYFVCNKTNKRVKHLLIVEGLFRTRHELNKMHYYSEHETVQDRDFRAARKIRRRFDKSTSIIHPMTMMSKPPNMHHATWDKWCFKELYYFKKINARSHQVLQKLQVRLNV